MEYYVTLTGKLKYYVNQQILCKPGLCQPEQMFGTDGLLTRAIAWSYNRLAESLDSIKPAGNARRL
jgi:hypothetical protein